MIKLDIPVWTNKHNFIIIEHDISLLLFYYTFLYQLAFERVDCFASVNDLL